MFATLTIDEGGFETMADLFEADDDNLRELGVKMGHRKRILKVRNLVRSSTTLIEYHLVTAR